MSLDSLFARPPSLREVAPGTWAWLQPVGSWGESNAGLVVGAGASALVDTLWDQRLTARMLEAMAPHLAGSPIELVVNTHADGDHWWGNALVPASARIVAARDAVAAMRTEPPPRELDRLGRLSRAAGRLPAALPLVPMGRYVGAFLRPLALGEVELRLPDDAFDGRRTEEVGGRRLELADMGPMHTASDSIVQLSDVGVVFTGDVLFNGVTPAMWHGPVESWTAALELLLGLDAEIFVPGHGEVAGKAEIRRLLDYWRWLDGVVTAQHAAGRNPWETTLAALRDPDFAPFRRWICPERLPINVTAIHRQRSGLPRIPTTPVARARIFAQVAKVARELESR